MLQVRKVDSVEVANYLMERMGKGSATAELIHPDELVAGVISQVAAEPDMGELLAAFVYSSEGEALKEAFPSPSGELWQSTPHQRSTNIPILGER